MRRESKCANCSETMHFDEGVILTIEPMVEPEVSPLEMLLMGGEMPGDEEQQPGLEEKKPVAFQGLICKKCLSRVRVSQPVLEQGRLRARAWWRHLLPRREDAELEERPCGFCGGNGRDGRLNCRVCEGSGQVIVESPSRSCQTCNGAGRGTMLRMFGVGGLCDFCRGTGWQRLK